MRNSDTSRLRQMGRRQFVETLIGLGVSTTVAQTVTADELVSLSGDLDDEVPRLRGFNWNAKTDDEGVLLDEPPEPTLDYYTIPRDIWEVVEAGRSAVRRLNKRLKQLDPSGALRAVKTSRVNGHKREHVIEVQYIEREIDGRPDGDTTLRTPNLSAQSVREQVPANVSGDPLELSSRDRGIVPAEGAYSIPSDVSVEDSDSDDAREISFPVTFTKVKERVEDCSSNSSPHFDDRYTSIPGGCRIKFDGPISSGTSCMPIWDSDNNEWVLLTCGHLVRGKGEVNWCAEQGFGRTAYQPPGGGSFGSVNKLQYHVNNTCIDFPMDAATVARDSGSRGFISALAGHGGSTHRSIEGGLSEEYITDMESFESHVENTMKQQGSTSCRTSGHIHYYGEEGDQNIFEFLNDTYSDNGDSGGPHYAVIDDRAYVGGVHRAGGSRTSDGENEYGALAVSLETIMDRMNLHVGDLR